MKIRENVSHCTVGKMKMYIDGPQVVFEKEISSIIESLERTAEALNALSRNKEAAIVKKHIRFLRDPDFVGKYKGIIEDGDVSPQAAVDSLVDKLTECILKQ
ncbi:hypothetical protein CHISP_2388 [Chitinispirillum alkaliphilum]|nr:hypothetical protein CHISP_2388 [Chitinispirillum alkaliphilum]